MSDPSAHSTFYKLSYKTQRKMRYLTRYISIPWTPFSALSTPHQKRNFASWLRRVWFDIVVMVLLLIVAYIIRAVDTPIFLERRRSFPMHYSREDSWYGPPYISHPKEKLRLDNLEAALCFTIIPIIVILALQVFIRSFWDLNAAIFGLLKGLVITYVSSLCFCFFAYLVGRLHFPR